MSAPSSQNYVYAGDFDSLDRIKEQVINEDTCKPVPSPASTDNPSISDHTAEGLTSPTTTQREMVGAVSATLPLANSSGNAQHQLESSTVQMTLIGSGSQTLTIANATEHVANNSLAQTTSGSAIGFQTNTIVTGANSVGRQLFGYSLIAKVSIYVCAHACM